MVTVTVSGLITVFAVAGGKVEGLMVKVML
jgi:hypothetical protein